MSHTVTLEPGGQSFAVAPGEAVLRALGSLRAALLDPVHHVLDAYLMRSELRVLDDGLLGDVGLGRD